MSSSNNTNNDISWYLKQINKYPPLTREEERALLLKINQGNEKAREKFIKHNLRLIVSIAKTFSYSSIPLEDLIQEGTFGLIYAIEKYNPSVNFRFSTNATNWIRHYIRRSIQNKALLIRQPVNIQQQISKIKQFIKKFEAQNMCPPSEEEISIGVKIPIKRLKELAPNMQMSYTEEDHLKTFIQYDKNIELIDTMSFLDSHSIQDLSSIL